MLGDVRRVDEHLEWKGWTDDKVLRLFYTFTEVHTLAWWIDEIDDDDDEDDEDDEDDA